MKKIILLIVFIASYTAFSQNIALIKQQGVVFIYFDENDSFQEKDKSNDESVMNYCWYKFTQLQKHKNDFKHPYLKRTITLVYTKYSDFDEMEKENPVFDAVVNKSFLRKNKSIILKRKTIKDEIGIYETLEILRNAKKIILIEKVNKREISLKEVKLFEIKEE